MNAPDPLAPPSPPPAEDAWRVSLRTAAILLLFTLVFTGLMAEVHELTSPAIEATLQEAKRRLIHEVLPASDFDNDLLADAIELPPLPALGLAEQSRLYRARRAGAPVALVLEAATPEGYSGEIRLILAVRADGHLAGVRVTRHKETPGLGDYIDPKKDKHKAAPWIRQFDGRHLGDTPLEKWRVKKDGGVFDARAGATISARAVTHATARALAWASERAARLFALPPGSRYEEESP
ncbi:MAG: electron transport complex subunit RsxG [Rhodocyclaceae bacterium]|nr:electron transport complex subunit RsxG [Rhodocyclaceae bacterium]